MKTKEQLIDSLGTWNDGGDRYPRSEVEKALDEYAEQQAIAFHIWADNVAVRAGADLWTIGAGHTTTAYTTSQLYALFIEHQNKTNQ